MPSPGLDGMYLAGSWRICGEVTLPICSLLCEGYVGETGNTLRYFTEVSIGIQVAVALLWYCFEVCIPIFK